MTIDEIIFKNFLYFTENKNDKIYYYLYPELISIIKSGIIQGINEEKYTIKMDDDIEIFERNRQTFENDSKLCSIIRGDKIDDFIEYVNQTNLSLSSQIKRSIYETYSIFNEKYPTLIEYATFFGSIQIMKYLNMNNIKLTPSIWLYAVHSNNPDILEFLEDKQILIDDRTFS